MFESMVSFILAEHLFGHNFVPPMGALGYTRVTGAWRRPYKTKDGYLCMMAYTERHWRKFWPAVGKPEICDDPRFNSIATRSHNVVALYELAGAFHAAIPVWNPLTGQSEQRTTIIDPLTGLERPVIGLKLPYVAALATGKLPRLLLGQWEMLGKLRTIPDTVEDFTGFSIEWDLIAGTLPGSEKYHAGGSAQVRNVELAAETSHIAMPRTRYLAGNPVTRAWIDSYDPASPVAAPPAGPGIDASNIVHAADIWYSVKKHWCLGAQRLINAGRAAIAAKGGAG